jgi:hypothetical protein
MSSKESKIQVESVIPDVEWKTVKRRICELIPHERNPRKMSNKTRQDLVESLQKFNYVELAAINDDNTILAGHQRIHTMQDLGWGDKEIDVRMPSRTLTEKECDEYLLVSNKVRGDWDFDVLSEKWEKEELLEGGFTDHDLLAGGCAEIILEGEEDERVKQARETKGAKKGDVYLLNDHKLKCGKGADGSAVEMVKAYRKYMDENEIGYVIKLNGETIYSS